MATKATTEQKKKVVKFGEKYGLDKDRKKIGAVDNAERNTKNPGENFQIFRIIVTQSRKRYETVNDNDELVKGKIDIVQFDVTHEDGSEGKYYSPNAPIVEACKTILADIGADEEGFLKEPVEVSKVIEGKGDKNRSYIAFA